MAATLAGVLLAGAPAPGARARARTVRLTLGPFPVEAHRDREVCRVVRVPGVAGMQVRSWEARSRLARKGLVGSHHFVAYGYSGSDAKAFPPASVLVDDPGCASLGPSDFFTRRAFLAGSPGNQAKGNWLVTGTEFPPGITQDLPVPGDTPDEAVVILNSHYFNESARPARGYVRLKLRLEPRDPAKRVLRQMTDTQASRAIKVAPYASGPEVEGTWAADGALNPATEGGVNPGSDVCILALSPHMHKRGAEFMIEFVEDGAPAKELLRTTDYLHPGFKLLPTLGTNVPGLLRASTAGNGHPRIRYRCRHANGAEGKELKMGCEERSGEVPGRSAVEAHPELAQFLGNDDHARPCGLDGANCAGFGTGRCVPANVVFGPLSDDEMCILVALVYDPKAGVPAEQACNPNF